MAYLNPGRNVPEGEAQEGRISSRIIGFLNYKLGTNYSVSGSSNQDIDRWIIESGHTVGGLAIKTRGYKTDFFVKHPAITPLRTYKSAQAISGSVYFACETKDQDIIIWDLKSPTVTGYYDQGYRSPKYNQEIRDNYRPSGHDACWFNFEDALYVLKNRTVRMNDTMRS